MESRIAVAWRTFMSMKDELTNKSYSINKRLRVFNRVVAPAALYGCAAWILTTSEETLLLRAERWMLRMIVGHSRRKTLNDLPDEAATESWVDWVKRTTRESEHRLNKMGVESWICQYRRRKWKFATQLVRDGKGKW